MKLFYFSQQKMTEHEVLKKKGFTPKMISINLKYKCSECGALHG